VSEFGTLRRNAGFTMRELARESGVTVATVFDHEHGLRGGWHPRTLRRLSDALGVDYHTVRKAVDAAREAKQAEREETATAV
jgi:transcriptional regulator with XRE-family HTH domain